MHTVGDLARFFSASRFQSQLQHRMDTAARALSTGEAGDKARHLSSDTLTLSLLDRKITLLGQQQANLTEAQFFTATAQSALGRIQSGLEDFANRIPLVSQSVTDNQVELITKNASNALVDVIDALNVRAGNRSVFAGAATDRAPLPSGRDVLDQLNADLDALPIGADIESALNDWFNDPAGPYLTTLYSGSDNAPLSLSTGVTQTIEFPVTAASPQTRDALVAMATSIAAGRLDSRLSDAEQTGLLRASKANTHAAIDGFIRQRASIGLLEEGIGVAQRETSADLDQLTLDKSSLIAVDEYVEITKFENAQQQLEILYRLAARQGQTSLAEYMR